MNTRATQLHATADGQIAALVDLLDGADEAALRKPCPDRAGLGDGTVRTLAAHTAANYARIAGFVAAGGDDGEHRELGASSADVIGQLSAARERMALVATLTDAELDAVPPKNSFRFCDGQRTLEQVLAGLFKHQDHQVQALAAAIA
jgi:hypothetical protein